MASSINSAPSAYWARRKKKTGAPSAMRSRRAVAASAASRRNSVTRVLGAKPCAFISSEKPIRPGSFPVRGNFSTKVPAPGVRFKIPCSTKFSSALRTVTRDTPYCRLSVCSGGIWSPFYRPLPESVPAGPLRCICTAAAYVPCFSRLSPFWVHCGYSFSIPPPHRKSKPMSNKKQIISFFNTNFYFILYLS